MRPILFALVVLSCALPASADIIAIRFKTPKDAAKFKDISVIRGGEPMVVGEKLVRENSASNNEVTELILANQDDPTKVPYKLDKEGKPDGIKNTVSIRAAQIAGTILLVKDGTLLSMAQDYSDRRKEYTDAIAARDAQTKASPPWLAAHQLVLLRGEKLSKWLGSTAFPGAAEKLEKELAKERKVAADAMAARLDEAKNSVQSEETPEDLVRIAMDISGGTDTFAVLRSKHCRIIYRSGIDELRVKELLILAEEIIDGWRVEFVDPYADASYEDYIQDHTMIEWFFGDNDIPKSEKYLTVYYKYAWDPKHKEESLQNAGHGLRRSVAPEYVHYWRTEDGSDLEGFIAHNLGHDLANIHFDKRRMNMVQDWLEEGSALYVALEWLGRNSVNCKAFAVDCKYAHEKKKAGEKTAQVGMRDWYNAVAVEAGSPIDRLALLTLFEFGDGDIAKSWSFFDWIAKKNGKQGQLFLRACCNASRTKTTFIKDWRAKAEEIFELMGQDVFRTLDEKWKEFAETGQDVGDTKKK